MLPAPGAGGIRAQGPPALGTRNPSVLVSSDPQLLQYCVMVRISAGGDPLLPAMFLLPLQPYTREKEGSTCFAHHVREK